MEKVSAWTDTQQVCTCWSTKHCQDTLQWDSLPLPNKSPCLEYILSNLAAPHPPVHRTTSAGWSSVALLPPSASCTTSVCCSHCAWRETEGLPPGRAPPGTTPTTTSRTLGWQLSSTTSQGATSTDTTPKDSKWSPVLYGITRRHRSRHSCVKTLFTACLACPSSGGPTAFYVYLCMFITLPFEQANTLTTMQ